MTSRTVFISNYSCRVDRIDKDNLLSEAILLTTDQELRARLITNVKSFKIQKASWELLRTPLGYTKEYHEVPELVGIIAYLNSGQQIREAVKYLPGIPLKLFFECIKGNVQAETYLVYERGCSSLEEYNEYFAAHSVDSCSYYANLDHVTNSWQGYVKGASAYRDHSLYYRTVNHHLARQKNDVIMVVSSLSDSFHEISIRASFAKPGVLAEIQGDFLRAPDNICLETINRLLLMSGKNISAMSKKELAQYVGGPCGCTHLLDLVYEMCQTVSVEMPF